MSPATLSDLHVFIQKGRSEKEKLHVSRMLLKLPRWRTCPILSLRRDTRSRLCFTVWILSHENFPTVFKQIALWPAGPTIPVRGSDPLVPLWLVCASISLHLAPPLLHLTAVISVLTDLNDRSFSVHLGHLRHGSAHVWGPFLALSSSSCYT